MFLYSISFLLMLFLSPVTMFGAEDAAVVEARCKRTEAARHQDILKASFISLLTDNSVDLEHGIAYGKSLWSLGLEKVFNLFVEDKAKVSGPSRPQVSVVQKQPFVEMIKENIEKFYNVDDPELVQKNQFFDASCETHVDALNLLNAIESASASSLPENRKANPEYILIQQHYNHLFEQYRFELYALLRSYQIILNPFVESKESYDKALTDFFAELQSKAYALNALHQKVLAAEAQFLVISTNASVASKERAQVCKSNLERLQSKVYDSRLQDALKLAILKCDDPALTQVDLLKFEMVIEQQDSIPLKSSAHFDRHDAKNLGKLFLVIAVVGAVFYNKYKKDQKVYLDKLHAKIIYAEMPKEKREALLKRLECYKIKYVPHWIRKRTKHDAFDKKVNALYQATREKKLEALQVSKKASV